MNQRMITDAFFFLFCSSIFIYIGVKAEDSIVLSTLPGTTGYLMTVPGNLESRLTTSASSISARTANFGDANLRISSIACDQGNQTLFIHDWATRRISRINYFTSWLNDTRLSLTVLHTGVSFVDSQVAYDWWNQNLYWTDGIYKWIVIQPAYTYDGLMYKVMITDNLYKPMALFVDPTNGYLFWSDIAPNPKIERSSLTGESRRTLISKSLTNPTSLAADQTTQAIYWTDSSRDTIETCSYAGQNRRVIRRLSGTQLQSIALHNDIVCATDPNNRRITCFRTSSGDLTLLLSGFQNTPWALALYDSSPRTTQTSPCIAKACEHICVTSSNVAQCMCKEGYTLNQDGKTCSDVHGLFSKGILLSNTSHICMFEIRIISGNSHDLSCVHGISGSISHIQSDGRKSLIFYAYSDNTNRNIRINNRVTLSTTTLVTTSLVSGLAYDWVGDYLYWSESDTGRIRGITMTTKFTFTVYNNIMTPTDLSIDPFNSTLYWISTEVSGNVIQSGTMDGRNKRTVISGSNSNNPSTLHFDAEENRLYWINSGSLRSCRPNGTDITYHLSTGNSNHLFIYKKYVIWTTDQLELRTARLSQSSADIIKSVASMGSVTGMTIFDAALQRQEKSACEVENGGCEEICVTNQASRICECSFGFQIQADNTSCDSTAFEDQFLLITDNSHGKVYQISLVNKSVVALKLPSLRSPVGIAYNYRSRQIVWSEIETGQIRQSTLSGENATIIYTLGYAFADRLTIDFSSGNIYFSENSRLGLGGSIRVVRLGVSPKTVVSNINDPRAISLYPSKGWMFYTDHANNSHITRSNMDGSGKTTIVSVSTKWPNGLTIDYIANRIYWTDGYHNKIESTDLNGGSRQELTVDTDAHMMSLVLDEPYIYYTAWSKQILTKLNKNTGQQEIWMSHTAEFGRLDSLEIYPGETQPVNSLCSTNNGQCSTYCLPTASGRVCACEDGVNLKSDGLACVGVTQCPLSIQNGNLNSSCLRYVGNKCSYDCLPEYRKNPEHDDITCEIGGIWNVPLQQLCIPVTCNVSIPNGSFINDCTGTLNKYCQYRCETGYKVNPSYPNVLCSMPGVWTPAPSQLCSRVQCSPEISNGYLQASCNRYAGENCSYNCNSGFKKNVSITSLSCLSNEQWDVNVEKLCEEIKCPDVIPNGDLKGCPTHIGSTCSFDCDSGFKEKTEVSVIYCLSSGKWTENITQLCIPVTCNVSIPNGSFINGCNGTLNNFCQYRCETGYKVNPSYPNVLCSMPGVWTPTPSQLCSRVQCPPEIADGYLQASCDRYAGEDCSYSCNSGFKKNVSITSLSCLSDGEWDINVQQLCEEIKCPDAVPNGDLKGCPTHIGSTCSFDCDSGFKEKTGVSVIYCLSSGEWTENITQLCTPIKCTAVIENGMLDPTCRKMVYESCRFNCTAGYKTVQNASTLTCQNNGEWNLDQTKICSAVTCNVSIPNGSFINGCTGTLNTYCQYRCETGYKVNPSYPNVLCSMSGVWTPAPSQLCSRVQCSNEISNGYLQASCNRYAGEDCSYSCNSGFKKNVSITSLSCLSDGEWNIKVEQLCEEIKCPDTIPNGDLKGCRTDIGSTCSFDCDSGFKEKTGVSVIYCLSSGKWTENITQLCIPIKCTGVIENGMLDPTCRKMVYENCRFNCTAGYETAHNANTLTCQNNGEWDLDQTKICSAVTCNVSIPNGSFINGCTGTLNNYCQYGCEIGYKVNPVYPNVLCSMHGVWTPATSQLCNRVQCSPEISNGYLQASCNRYAGEDCSYSCNSGFKKNVSITSLACLSDGEWDIKVEQLCEEIKCPDAIPNGDLKGCPTDIGSTCSFDCDSGFKEKTGVSVIYCLSSGEWTENITQLCIPIKCTEVIENGILDQRCRRTVHESCEFNCTEGFETAHNTNTLTCQNNGEWDLDQTKICSAVKCPSEIPNGRLAASCDNRYGQSCDYYCNNGYRKHGVIEKITCDADTKWNVNEHTLCEPIICDVEQPEVEFNNDCNGTRNENCQYNCIRGYKRVLQTNTVSCTSEGIWNPSLELLCNLILCPLAIPNGQLVESCDRHVDETCDYNCNSGYERNDKVKSLQCDVSGKWDESAEAACEGDETEPTSAPVTNTVNIGAIVGGAVGVGLIIVLSIAGILVCRKQRRNRKNTYSEQQNIDSVSQINDKDVVRPVSDQYAYIQDDTPEDHYFIIPGDRQSNPYEDGGYESPQSLSNGNNFQSFNNPAFSISELYPPENKSVEYANTAIIQQETEMPNELSSTILLPEVQSDTLYKQPPVVPPKPLNPKTLPSESIESNSKILLPEVNSDTLYKKPPTVPPKPLMKTNEDSPYELTKTEAEDNDYTSLTRHRKY